MVPILVTITAGFGAFALYVDRVEIASRLADVDAELARAERGAVTPQDPTDARPPAPGGVDQPADIEPLPDDADAPIQLVVGPDGTVEPTAGTNPFDATTLARFAAGSGVRTATEGDYRVLIRPSVGGDVSITALPLDATNEATDDFRRALALGGIVIGALMAGVVWAVTTSLIRPVTEITATAARIADGDVDTVIGTPSRSKEMVELADDLDRMLATLRAALLDSERSATEAARSRDGIRRLLADMSHELRTPLTALKGYSDLYAGGMLETDDDLDRAMGRIGSESDRLGRLANDMLQLARGADGADIVESVDLVEVAHDVVDDLRAAHPELDIDVDIGINAASGPSAVLVNGSPGQIHQAVLNLTSNACRYAGSEGGVKVVVGTIADAATVAVVDHGPGIAPEERDRVFLPFYRPDGSRSRDGRGGAGLGLALTRQIVTNHGGSVTIEGTPGGGATVTMTIPTEPPVDDEENQ